MHNQLHKQTTHNQETHRVLVPVFSTTWLMLAGLLASQVHASEQYVSVQRMQYQESDQRMKIDYVTASILKDFGTDFTLSANVSKDMMSGATPIWDFASGASRYVNLDENGLIGADEAGAKTSMADFDYSLHEMEDERVAGDVSLTWRTPEARDELTVGLSTSKEEDYRSRGLSAQYLHYLDPSKNRSITAGFSVLDNEAEFRRTTKGGTPEWKDAQYYNAQISITQVFSPTQIASASMFSMYETGALTNPYQTVVRAINIGSEASPNYRLFLAPEKRPDTRKVLGINLTGNQKFNETFIGIPITLHGAYRIYQDDWGQTAHSLKGNAYVGDLDGYGQFMFGARLMQQRAANFFKDPQAQDNYFNQTDYASADERLGNMTTLSAEVGYEKRFADHWHVITHAAYQKQSKASDLSLYWLSAGLRYDY